MSVKYIEDFLIMKLIQKYGVLDLNCTIEKLFQYYLFYQENYYPNPITYLQININNFCNRESKKILDYSKERYGLNCDQFKSKFIFWKENLNPSTSKPS
jgi:hypothetical protein